MTDRKRSILALVLVLVLAFAVAASGCTKTTTQGGGTSTSSGPVKGGTMSYYIGDPAYIDPYNTNESEGTQVEQSLFDSLTTFDPLDASKLVPAAAEKWEANADATVWTFHLDKNDKFADGSPVTANDFIYAWDRIVNPKTINTITKKVDASIIGYHLQAVNGYNDVVDGRATQMSGLKAVDDNTLQVTLSYPFGDFEYVVAHPALAPVQQKYVEGGVDYNGTKVAFGDMPQGNGPFKMVEPWKHGQYVKVVRNDVYYGERPYIDGVDFRTFKDSDTAYLEFEAGNLDFTQIGTGKIKDALAKYGESKNGYTANPGKQVLLGAENGIYSIVINTKKFTNKDLRRAISLALNRQAIADAVFQGTRNPADNIVPPSIAGYEKGGWPDARYDVAAAKQALVAAGFPGGKGAPDIQLQYNADNSDHQKVMELVQADLKAIGLNAPLASTPDFPTYLKEWHAGKGQIGRIGWQADYPIIDDFLFPLFGSTSSDNYSGYSSPAVDKGIQDARKITDRAARLKAYDDVNKVIAADVPEAPLLFYRHNFVASSRVHDLTYSAQDLADFTKVWLTGGGAGASTEATTK